MTVSVIFPATKAYVNLSCSPTLSYMTIATTMTTAFSMHIFLVRLHPVCRHRVLCFRKRGFLEHIPCGKLQILIGLSYRYSTRCCEILATDYAVARISQQRVEY